MMYFVIDERMEKLAKDNKLKPIDLLILANIYSFTKQKKDCTISLKNFADKFNVSYPTVIKSVQKLEDKKLIEKGKKQIYGNYPYIVTKQCMDLIDGENNAQNDEIENKNEKVTNTTPKEEKAENKANTDELANNTSEELTEEQKRELFIKEYSNKPYSFQEGYY